MEPNSPPPSYEECMNSRPHTPQSSYYGSGGHQVIPTFPQNPNDSCHSSRAATPTPRIYNHGEHIVPIMCPPPPGVQNGLPLQTRQEDNVAMECLKSVIIGVICLFVFVMFFVWQTSTSSCTSLLVVIIGIIMVCYAIIYITTKKKR
ncbi:unnamed protein product, partial [Mesorhabditis belari]|uniref:Uncharacterized protein n=1 Tax=Mesorhabditis belari TaxID=2138241 RepID=A0AAF3F139_9BILA